MKKFFLGYVPYYKNYKLKFTFAFIGILLVSGGTSGTAYIMKPLLDDIFINKDEAMLTILPLFIIAVYMAKGFGRFIQVYFISYIGQDIIRLVRDKLYAHLLGLDMAFFNRKHSGELISKITNDINRIQTAVSTKIATILQEIITIIALIGMTIYLNPMLAFYGLVVLPLVIFPLRKLAKKMKKISFRSQEKNSDITAHLSESFNNIELIKASNTEHTEGLRFFKHNKSFFDLNMKAVKTNELVSPLMEIAGSIAIATVIIVGGGLVIDDQMSAGSFFSFVTALFMLYTPIKRLSSVYNSLQDAIAAQQRVDELFAKKPTIISGVQKMSDNISNIKFENVCLSFGDTKALDDINLEIKKGEKLALVGDSGGGKSSLVNLIMRFYDSQTGSITIDGIDIKDYSLKSLRKNIAIITQRVYIFNDTIEANICYGQPYDKEKIISALKSAYAYEFVMELKHGTQTILQEQGTNLSGGQRQRIAIARALYRQPQIIIFDEATSALDNTSEQKITKVLQELSVDKIVIIIAHRLSTIKKAKKLALFQNGNIICYGDQEYMATKCQAYKKLKNIV